MVPLAPPSLGYFLWGFPFSALDVPRGNHTLKDSQQSVVHHERAPSQELERQVSHGALYKASSTFSTPECAHVAAGVFLADEIFLPFFFVLVGFLFSSMVETIRDLASDCGAGYRIGPL